MVMLRDFFNGILSYKVRKGANVHDCGGGGGGKCPFYTGTGTVTGKKSVI